jgi:hypothetical protein
MGAISEGMVEGIEHQVALDLRDRAPDERACLPSVAPRAPTAAPRPHRAGSRPSGPDGEVWSVALLAAWSVPADTVVSG